MTRLTVTLENNFYTHGKNLNHEEKSIIKRAMRLAKITTYLYFGSLCTTTCIMILTPPILALTSEQKNSTIQHGNKFLIWKAWWPVDTTVYPYNILAYIHQAVLTSIEGCFIIGGLNAFYLVLIIYTNLSVRASVLIPQECQQNIQDEIKKDSIINKAISGSEIGTLVDAGSVEESNIQHTFSDPDTEALYFTRVDEHKVSTYMKECIQYHQRLLEYADDLNGMLSPLMFMELITASLIICMLGFQLILMPLNMKFFQMLTHLFTAVFELGLFCWFGSSLITQSEEVHNAAYESGWYDMANVRRHVQMMIMRGQKPVVLRTGQFGTLSMPLFAELMKASYTYLTMLKQFQEG